MKEQTIGDRIRLSRHAKRLSQEELAMRCGISRQTIYEYEKGIYIPKLDNAGKLANALEVELDYICYGRKKNERSVHLTYSEVIRSILDMESVGVATLNIVGNSIQLKIIDEDIVKAITQIKTLKELTSKINLETFEKVVEEVLDTYNIAIIKK